MGIFNFDVRFINFKLFIDKKEGKMAFSEEKIKRAVLKLEQSAGWIKFLGVVQLIYGIITAITLVGILWIWLGLVLIKAANNLRMAKEGDEEALIEASSNLSTFFTVWGIVGLIGLIIGVVGIVIWLIVAGTIMSQSMAS